jgi:hypothetical protein
MSSDVRQTVRFLVREPLLAVAILLMLLTNLESCLHCRH